jgi:translocation and assembly module TamA
VRRPSLALSLLLVACAGGQKPAEGEPGGPLVHELRIDGTRAVDPSKILDRIATRGPTGLPLLRSHPHLDPGALPMDEQRVKDIYEEQGFFAAQARAEVVTLDDGRVDVVFHVTEGPPTVVRSVLLVGLEELDPMARGRVLVGAPLRVGDRLVEASYTALTEQIQHRLEAEGYARADVQGRVEIAPGTGSADVLVQVQTGTRYRFGPIEVEGNELVPAEKIHDAAATVLKTGDYYSPEVLQEAQAEVLALGPFAVVSATTADPTENSDVLAVRISVRESNFLRLRFGAGVGVENDRQQVRGIVDLAHLNLWGDLQRLQFSNELAYRFIPTVVNPATAGPAGVSQLTLTQPDLITTRADLSTSLRYERQLLQAFSSQQVGGRVAVPVRLRRWLTITPSYNIDYYFDVTGRADIPLRNGQRATQLLACGSQCVLSYLEQVISADRRDALFEPTSGWYAALGLQEGGGPLQGEFDWIRIAPEVRGYLPLSRELTLAGRLLFGYLQPLATGRCVGPLPGTDANCSPIVVRFFGGGASGFRGYGADQLGPVLRIVRGNGVELIPLGGNSQFLSSGELRWRVAQEWTLAAFTDVASVGASPTGAFSRDALELAVGGGARYHTPVGPARLDLGFRPFTQDRTAVTPDGRIVTIPQQFIDRFAIFLSLGEAF